MSTKEPRNESVTQIIDGKQKLFAANLTFGEAYSLVVDLRTIAQDYKDKAPYHYYRIGRPH